MSELRREILYRTFFATGPDTDTGSGTNSGSYTAAGSDTDTGPHTATESGTRAGPNTANGPDIRTEKSYERDHYCSYDRFAGCLNNNDNHVR